MAKGSHGGGAGSAKRSGVEGTMAAPFSKAVNSRPSNHMKGPFDQAPAGGGIPVTMYDGMASKAGTRMPSPGQNAPSSQGGKRPGTKSYPFGGGGMKDGN